MKVLDRSAVGLRTLVLAAQLVGICCVDGGAAVAQDISAGALNPGFCRAATARVTHRLTSSGRPDPAASFLHADHLSVDLLLGDAGSNQQVRSADTIAI